jgi:hypothetical protein
MKTQIKVIIAVSMATLMGGMTFAGTSFANRCGLERRGGEYGC